MRRSTSRILVSHAGTVPRPADLQALFDARERLSGLEQPTGGAVQASARNIVARDARDYPEFHALGGGRMRRAAPPIAPGGNVNPTVTCTAPIAYVGQQATARDIA